MLLCGRCRWEDILRATEQTGMIPHTFCVRRASKSDFAEIHEFLRLLLGAVHRGEGIIARLREHDFLSFWCCYRGFLLLGGIDRKWRSQIWQFFRPTHIGSEYRHARNPFSIMDRWNSWGRREPRKKYPTRGQWPYQRSTRSDANWASPFVRLDGDSGANFDKNAHKSWKVVAPSIGG